MTTRNESFYIWERSETEFDVMEAVSGIKVSSFGTREAAEKVIPILQDRPEGWPLFVKGTVGGVL